MHTSCSRILLQRKEPPPESTEPRDRETYREKRNIMLTFPTLKTAAAVQYPLTVSEAFSTEVLQFLAGDEQRYLASPGELRAWSIQLEQLDEAELESIEAFFVAAAGSFETFSFPDPASGTTYPNCFIAQDLLHETFSGELRTATTILIQQGRA